VYTYVCACMIPRAAGVFSASSNNNGHIANCLSNSLVILIYFSKSCIRSLGDVGDFLRLFFVGLVGTGAAGGGCGDSGGGSGGGSGGVSGGGSCRGVSAEELRWWGVVGVSSVDNCRPRSSSKRENEPCTKLASMASSSSTRVRLPWHASIIEV
jgi:hypothetical protein